MNRAWLAPLAIWSAAADFLVTRLVEQLGATVVDAVQPDHPALAVRVGVDSLGCVGELVVDAGDRSTNRCVQVAGRLHGLDGPELAARLEHGSDRGQLDEDDVTQLGLGVVADADGGHATLDVNPLVALGEAVLAEVGHSSISLGSFVEPQRHNLCVRLGPADVNGSVAVLPEIAND